MGKVKNMNETISTFVKDFLESNKIDSEIIDMI